MNVDEIHKLQEDQNKRKAVAAEFLDDTTEQEVVELLTETTVGAGMLTERIQIKCPAKPITHAFL